jgi:hypothetical protein
MLQIRFLDGLLGEHDFSDMVAEPGSMLEPLRELDYFARCSLNSGRRPSRTGIDIAPEWLRREMARAASPRCNLNAALIDGWNMYLRFVVALLALTPHAAVAEKGPGFRGTREAGAGGW